MFYSAYGSNMSIARLQERVPSAVPLGCYTLAQHDLRFHKSGRDGSAKCDAYFTADGADTVHGALFEMHPSHKPALDEAEGLGYGYREKGVTVIAARDGASVTAFTYVAIRINEHLKPYSWYLNHVLVGATETSLRADYVQGKIATVEAIHDHDEERDARERSLHPARTTVRAT